MVVGGLVPLKVQGVKLALDRELWREVASRC